MVGVMERLLQTFGRFITCLRMIGVLFGDYFVPNVTVYSVSDSICLLLCS